VRNAFRSHPEIRMLRVGEGTGSHDPGLRIPLLNVVGIEAVLPGNPRRNPDLLLMLLFWALSMSRDILRAQ
jgi:hypothetical protein